MDSCKILDDLGVCTEEELQVIERLPEQHKDSIFEALAKHFAKFPDTLKNVSDIPSRSDL